MLSGLLLRMPRGLVDDILSVIKVEPGTNYRIVRGKPCGLKERMGHCQALGTYTDCVSIEEHGDDYHGDSVAHQGKTADGILRSFPFAHIKGGELRGHVRQGECLAHILDG